MTDTFDAVVRFVKFRVRIIDPNFDIDKWYTSIDENEPEGEAELPTIVTPVVLYVNGPGCPVPISFEVSKIFLEYDKEYPAIGDIGTLYASVEEYNEKRRRVTTLLRRNMLLAISPKMDIEVANILANDNSSGRTMLVRAGWLPEIEPDVVEDNDEENKTDPNSVETGEETSATSPQTTQE